MLETEGKLSRPSMGQFIKFLGPKMCMPTFSVARKWLATFLSSSYVWPGTKKLYRKRTWTLVLSRLHTLLTIYKKWLIIERVKPHPSRIGTGNPCSRQVGHSNHKTSYKTGDLRNKN